jgi:pimeloyl-ACP methyl ester carboxylesterase
VVVIEGSGHFPWLECPDAFREAVEAFLDEFLRRQAP